MAGFLRVIDRACQCGEKCRVHDWLIPNVLERKDTGPWNGYSNMWPRPDYPGGMAMENAVETGNDMNFLVRDRSAEYRVFADAS